MVLIVGCCRSLQVVAHYFGWVAVLVEYVRYVHGFWLNGVIIMKRKKSQIGKQILKIQVTNNKKKLSNKFFLQTNGKKRTVKLTFNS